jgi:para-nitrobenzyl esterase
MLSVRILTLFAAVSLLLSAAMTQPVHLKGGLVAGSPGTDPAITTFKGIQYAAPPVGDLRWRAPQPPAPWQGVLKADQFSASCMQNDAGWFPPNNGARPDRQISEDCLYANVYTPAKSASEKHPVMLFVHGGGLTFSAGTYYDGEALAEQGIVVVTFNYRLGLFGFFAHPELSKESGHNASGNYGFLDQIVALQWVHDNIQAFGGDPNQVTLAGQSAGAWSINYLMASPLTKGLYQRVIGESGGQWAHGKSLAEAEAAGVQFAKTAGYETVAALRQRPAAELQKAGRASVLNIDGWVMPDNVESIFARGKQNDVPMLVGSNAGEATSPRTSNSTVTSFTDTLKKEFGDDASTVIGLYPAKTEEEARFQQLEFHRDQTFGWPTWAWAKAEATTGKSKVYFYYFDHVSPGPYADAHLAAPHGGELAYVFNWANSPGGNGTEWRDADKKLATQVTQYWVNFVKTGDPNGKGLPVWPAYRPGTNTVFVFHDGGGTAEALPHESQLKFLDEFYAKTGATTGR